MSKELKRLTEEAHLHRCWGDEPPPELLEQIETEKRKNEPSQELLDTLAHLRRKWAEAAVSQKRKRHIFFLGSVYEQVCKWRHLKRQDDLAAGLVKFFDVEPLERDIFQLLLVAVCDEQIDRKIRHRWAACLRTVDRRKTPPDLGAAQIIYSGGINRCAGRSRQKKRRA